MRMMLTAAVEEEKLEPLLLLLKIENISSSWTCCVVGYILHLSTQPCAREFMSRYIIQRLWHQSFWAIHIILSDLLNHAKAEEYCGGSSSSTTNPFGKIHFSWKHCEKRVVFLHIDLVFASRYCASWEMVGPGCISEKNIYRVSSRNILV